MSVILELEIMLFVVIYQDIYAFFVLARNSCTIFCFFMDDKPL